MTAHLVEVEDQVELADVLKCPIQGLDKDLKTVSAMVVGVGGASHLYQVQYTQLGLSAIYDKAATEISSAPPTSMPYQGRARRP